MVIGSNAAHPVDKVYAAVAVPAASALTTPPLVILATVPDGVTLHTPPTVISLSVVVYPAHSVLAPIMPVGTAFTVIGMLMLHPPIVYVIVSNPGATPLTMPPDVTVAFAGLLLVHIPPAVPSLSVVVPPTHTLGVPPIGTGDELTVTTVAVEQPLPSE